MSIQTDLTRIKNAKAAIKAAIEGKGVTVPDATLLDGMASLIESIEAGGVGGNGLAIGKAISGSFTFSSDTEIAFEIEIANDIGVSRNADILCCFTKAQINNTSYIDAMIGFEHQIYQRVNKVVMYGANARYYNADSQTNAWLSTNSATINIKITPSSTSSTKKPFMAGTEYYYIALWIGD